MEKKIVDKRQWYQILWELLQKKEEIRTAVILTEPFVGSRVLWEDGGMVGTGQFSQEINNVEIWKEIMNHPGVYEIMEWGMKVSVYVEVISRRPRLVILGGGHISKSLCIMGKMLGFHVTVMDDRSEFANLERFSEADEVICDSFSQCGSRITDMPNTYYVIVTRGHQGDFVCAMQILSRQSAYVGMIGSHAKVEKTKEKLEKDGMSRECLEKLHAPIGLKIGAQTPEETGISIMAQIIQVKNSRDVHGLDGNMGDWFNNADAGLAVMAEIIEKKGSAPRGAGSRMLILSDGSSMGSVGGGLAEYSVMKTAKDMKQDQILEFRMDGRESASTGMICGGKIRVLMEMIG